MRTLLNDLRKEEATPHKIQRVWDTLKWYSRKFGLLQVDSIHRLQEKRGNPGGPGAHVPTVTQPQRKAVVLEKPVVWALELGATGVGAIGPDGALNLEARPKLSLAEKYVTSDQIPSGLQWQVQ